MALLTLEGFEVPVLPGTEVQDEPWGDYARAYSGRLRSDRRASHRVVRVIASLFDTADDAVALRTILNTPGPVLAGGTMIGDDAYFHVRQIRFAPQTVDRLSFSFELHETDDSPSALLFSFDGDAPGTYTFTRSGNVGPFTNANGLLRRAAANVLRREYLWLDGTYTVATRPDTPSYLLEPAFTNLVTSDNFDSGWADSGTPVVTASISDPAGGTSAYRIEDNDSPGVDYKTLTVAFTGDGVKAFVFVVREATMATPGNQGVQVVDDTAAASRLVLEISAWVSGAPTVAATTGTYLGKRYIGNGYWALYALSTSITAANTNTIGVLPAITGAATGSIDIYRVNAYNAATPPWSILNASEALGTEVWYSTFAAVPQAMTGLIDFVEGIYPTAAGNYRLLQIGNAGGTGARLIVYRTSGADTYTVAHYNSAGASVSATVDINPAWGNHVRLRWVLNADGSVQIGAAIDTGSGFGAETVGSASAANALSFAWGDTRVYLSHPDQPGVAAFLSAKIARGVQTMAYMREVARGRLHPRTADPASTLILSASAAGAATATAVES